MRALLSEPRNQDEVPAARQLASLDAAIVLAEVARYYGVDQDCFQVRRSGLLGRDLAAWLVRHHSSATLRELAPIFGLNHPDSVNNLVRRVDRALARSSQLREDIGMIQRILEQRRHGPSR
jgi:chromosomal replication initiation ATPase DnaA